MQQILKQWQRSTPSKVPSFNPLIIHVDSLEKAQNTPFNPSAIKLAAAFWPGPLTLVMPLQNTHQLSPLVTAGLHTIAVRCPNHPVALNCYLNTQIPLQLQCQ